MKLSLNNFLYGIKQIVTGDKETDGGFLVDRSVVANQVVAAASTTAVATVSLLVPRDYDEQLDELTVDIVAKMAGSTDTPTVTLAPTQDGTALVASSGTLVTAALSSTATRYTFKLNGNAVKRDGLLSLVFTSGAHTTDALDLIAVRVSYRSTLVSYNEEDASGNALR